MPESTEWGDTLLLAFVQFSSSAEAGKRGAPARRSLKTEQRAKRRHEHEARAPLRSDPVDVRDVNPPLPEGDGGILLPRKEVIQPQLPLRLPCYDFTPITGPTFDGCLPEG